MSTGLYFCQVFEVLNFLQENVERFRNLKPEVHILRNNPVRTYVSTAERLVRLVVKIV
jgi:hypothetical protein